MIRLRGFALAEVVDPMSLDAVIGAGGVLTVTTDDAALVEAVNRCTGARLTVRGRSLLGKLGGAIFVEWPDGHPGVVTVFHGGIADAQRVASVLNRLQARGLPVPRHELVVDLGDRVVFVQHQLPMGPSRQLTVKRIEGLVEINERFAGAVACLPDVPSVTEWFRPAGGDGRQIVELVPEGDRRASDVVNEIVRLITEAPRDVLAGHDLVHVDLSAANVLFDEDDSATAVVDWNLGVYRGDCRLALVQTRFDREWFVRRADADQIEVAAARRLDEILIDQIRPNLLRVYWAYWLHHQLSKALRIGTSTVIDWQLEFAESRLQ